MAGEFWDEDEFAGMFTNTTNSQVIAAHLGGDVPATSMAELTDGGRSRAGVLLLSPVGTRVSFNGNLGAVLSYPFPPKHGTKGTIVKVRTSSGDATHQDDLIFVRWDDGNFTPTHRDHIRLSTEKIDHRYRKGHVKTYDRFIVASLGILGDEFFVTAGGDPDLVHKATKDLWSFEKTEEGYVIERLFNETGEPLKV